MKSLASTRSDAIVTDVANFRIDSLPVGPPRLGTPCCQPLAPQLHQAALTVISVDSHSPDFFSSVQRVAKHSFNERIRPKPE